MMRKLLSPFLASKARYVASIVILTLCAVGCNAESDHLVLLVRDLGFAYYRWDKDGRHDSASVSQYIETGHQPGSDVLLDYTNTVFVGTNIYHCRFGVRSPSFIRAPGVVAITDDKVFLFIRDSDGKVIVSPEKMRFRFHSAD